MVKPGSPPLARVPPHIFKQGRTGRGITPARAGTTQRRDSAAVISEDHPRSRGYHILNCFSSGACKGSPPLARVPPLDLSEALCGRGITPARAGTTCPSASRPGTLWDHPRSRGYHCQDHRLRGILQGSPPLARVPPEITGVPMDDLRITPARAGTTPDLMPWRCRNWDHPRSRGYHAIRPGLSFQRPGSPPLARVPLRPDCD